MGWTKVNLGRRVEDWGMDSKTGELWGGGGITVGGDHHMSRGMGRGRGKGGRQGGQRHRGNLGVGLESWE